MDGRVDAEFLHHHHHLGIEPLGDGAGGECLVAAGMERTAPSLGHLAAARVAGAEEQDLGRSHWSPGESELNRRNGGTEGDREEPYFHDLVAVLRSSVSLVQSGLNQHVLFATAPSAVTDVAQVST